MLPYTEGVAGWDRMEAAVKLGGIFGAVVGAVKANWDMAGYKAAPPTAQQSLTRFGGSVLLFAGVAGAYAGSEALLESLRGKADWRNGAMAGLASGAVVGLARGSPSAALTWGILFSATSASVDALGGKNRVDIFSESGQPANPFPHKLDLDRP
eukprot:TRINITY_DN7976_c0_g1_i1.p3 TRINITY_DN7976_c0_g1~~TRINITY_DN7976_c0_g1_i1.p3  ORF type:complete len:154 (-),score=21.42 TRINITY_DN7976_c0_g1_i1:300-761(-)